MVARARPSRGTAARGRRATSEELHALQEERERRATRPHPSRPAGTALEAFLYRYLPHHFDSQPGAFHRAIYGDLDSFVLGREVGGEVRTGAAFAYPRSHGKSTTVTIGFALWVLYHWRSMPHFRGKPPYILIISSGADEARSRSLDLREELEGNEALARDFGPRAPLPADREGTQKKGKNGKFKPRAKWTETDWTTSDGCKVKSMGSLGKVRGLLRSARRPTLILIDDLEDDKLVDTIEQRKKLERWFKRSLLSVPRQGHGLFLLVGTVLHADSLLAKLLRRDEFPRWLKRRHAACTTPDGTPAAPVPYGPGTVPLWPEEFPLERLARVYEDLGSLAFSQEWLNQPVDDENSPFKLEWLEAALEAGRGVPFCYAPLPVLGYDEVTATWDLRDHPLASTHYQVVITAFDLALVVDERQARERDTDFTTGITVGLTCAEDVEVRRMYHRRGMTPDEMRGRIRAEHEITGASYVVIENNAAQLLVEWDLRAMGVPVTGHQTDRRKRSLFEGVPAMALLFETRRILFCHATAKEREMLEILKAELHGLGVEAHDDAVMALWMALRVLWRWTRRRNQERAKVAGARPPGSVAGIFPVRPEELAR